MRLRGQFYPPDRARANKCDFFAKFKYVMFPEMADDFPQPFKLETVVPMNADYDDEENMFYEIEVQRPYGSFDEMQVCSRTKGAAEDDPGYELRPLMDATNMKGVHFDVEPKPISAEAQKERD